MKLIRELLCDEPVRHGRQRFEETTLPQSLLLEEVVLAERVRMVSRAEQWPGIWQVLPLVGLTRAAPPSAVEGLGCSHFLKECFLKEYFLKGNATGYLLLSQGNYAF